MEISVLFTDLDGTLLDPEGGVGDAPAAAVARLRALGVPVVPLTSKTEVELRALLPVLAAGGTGVFENGAGLVTPRGVKVVPAAVPVTHLRQILAAVAHRRGIRVVPLDEMTDERLQARTGLRGAALAGARARVWDLPFLAPDGGDDELEEEVEAYGGVQLVRGGVFWHLSGRHDKADAVPGIRELFGRGGMTVGLGDAPNDLRFLSAVDVPVVVPRAGGPDGRLLAALPGARVAPEPGGAGWAAAVAALLEGGAA
jgi:mannosyl-3-phosphoglycerate phosphatase